jgi:hypothetical protein
MQEANMSFFEADSAVKPRYKVLRKEDRTKAFLKLLNLKHEYPDDKSIEKALQDALVKITAKTKTQDDLVQYIAAAKEAKAWDILVHHLPSKEKQKWLDAALTEKVIVVGKSNPNQIYKDCLEGIITALEKKSNRLWGSWGARAKADALKEALHHAIEKGADLSTDIRVLEALAINRRPTFFFGLGGNKIRFKGTLEIDLETEQKVSRSFDRFKAAVNEFRSQKNNVSTNSSPPGTESNTSASKP